MDSSPQQLQERLSEMSSEQVKSLMLAWLKDDAQSRQRFSNWVETTQPAMEWGESTSQLTFQPLNETEMLAQSLETLTEYRDNRQSIAHQDVAA